MGKALMLAGELDEADGAFKSGTIEVLTANGGGSRII